MPATELFQKNFDQAGLGQPEQEAYFDAVTGTFKVEGIRQEVYSNAQLAALFATQPLILIGILEKAATPEFQAKISAIMAKKGYTEDWNRIFFTRHVVSSIAQLKLHHQEVQKLQGKKSKA